MEIKNDKLILTKKEKKEIRIIQNSEIIYTDNQPLHFKKMGIDEKFIHKVTVLLGGGNSTYYYDVW